MDTVKTRSSMILMNQKNVTSLTPKKGEMTKERCKNKLHDLNPPSS